VPPLHLVQPGKKFIGGRADKPFVFHEEPQQQLPILERVFHVPNRNPSSSTSGQTRRLIFEEHPDEQAPTPPRGDLVERWITPIRKVTFKPSVPGGPGTSEQNVHIKWKYTPKRVHNPVYAGIECIEDINMAGRHSSQETNFTTLRTRELPEYARAMPAPPQSTWWSDHRELKLTGDLSALSYLSDSQLAELGRPGGTQFL